MSDEEGVKPFMTENQRENLTSLDLFYLTLNLSKFCAKNCGVFKTQAELNAFPTDCLKNCVDNVERTYEKFTSTLKASLVQGGEGAEE